MTLRVHLLQDFDSDFVQSLRARLSAGIELTSGDIHGKPQFEILIAGVPERRQLTASPRLRTLIIPWAGLPRKTRELLLELPHIAVHNIHHNAIPTAETAIALMLAATKNLIPIDRKLRQGDWRPRYAEARAPLLHGRTAVILGYGAIGRHVARVCLALGTTVKAMRKTVTGDDPRVEVFTPDKLLQLLPEADVLFLALPSTPETEGMIGPQELALLPAGATLVNIARGAVVHEEALYKELASGRLRAGLDVWYNYPRSEPERSETLPASFPFHELENVVMTPHLGGHADQTEELRLTELARLLNDVAAGKPLPNRVEVGRGY